MISDRQCHILKDQAKAIRKMTIAAIGNLGVGHIGGAMSIVETLVLLYYHHLKVDPQTHGDADRNLLVFSKGHAGPALYATLAAKGFFDAAWLDSLNRGGTRLPSHCDMNLTPGIDMTTGSLGQGLSAAVGMALANRTDGFDRYVYTILGDGECHEGQVWEAAMAAAHYKLNRLVAFVDYNKLGLDGYLSDVMEIADITSKWSAFGWNVDRVDGHDLKAIDKAICAAKLSPEHPSVIILDTIKGKGCFFAEGRVESHSMAFDSQKADEAITRLDTECEVSCG